MFGKYDKKTIRPKYENANIPILILDPEWVNRFSEKYMTEKASELEGSLRECFKQQAWLTDTVKKLSQTKKNNLEYILRLSAEIFNNDSSVAKRDMERLQAEVTDINETLDKLSLDLEKIPLEVDRLNMELLDETVEIIYKEMAESRTQLESINPEIIRLKAALEYMKSEKKNHDEIYQNADILLTSLLGKEGLAQLESVQRSKQERGLNGFGRRNRYSRNRKN